LSITPRELNHVKVFGELEDERTRKKASQSARPREEGQDQSIEEEEAGDDLLGPESVQEVKASPILPSS